MRLHAVLDHGTHLILGMFFLLDLTALIKASVKKSGQIQPHLKQIMLGYDTLE